jgi:hypothetical protein
MSTAVSVESRVSRVEVTDEVITAYLVDGRIISVPLVWSWRLSDANPAQRANWTLIGDGQGVHWPDVDEDLSAEGMLHGIPAHRPRTRATSPCATPLANKAVQPTSRARQRTNRSRLPVHAARG